jgi:hypothetical protein
MTGIFLLNRPSLIVADVFLDYPGDIKLGALFPIHKQVQINKHHNLYVATAFIQIICISCHCQNCDTLLDRKLRAICFGTKIVKVVLTNREK